MVSIKSILEKTLGLPENSLKLKSVEITKTIQLNDENDGIPPKPKGVGYPA